LVHLHRSGPITINDRRQDLLSDFKVPSRRTSAIVGIYLSTLVLTISAEERTSFDITRTSIAPSFRLRNARDNHGISSPHRHAHFYG